MWLLLPSSFVITHALIPAIGGQRQLTLVEGVNEVVTVMDDPGKGRMLYTNGYSMSSTTLTSQRYQRALAHIPLLAMDRPETALVIGFGVGNTTNAVTLHPTIRRVEIADLSRQVLDHAGYFKDANKDVLHDPRVVVYVDAWQTASPGMQKEGTYDLIALEPPPIALAGVGALYSREFYALARTRLTSKGYISQWLPAYQVPAETTLAMVRAFVDIFPQAVLLCGANQEMLLVGTRDSRIEIDPNRLAVALADAPAVQADLQRVGLGTITEMIGTFVGSPQTLRDASRGSRPVTDDLPMQEYGARSRLNSGYRLLPASVFDVSFVAMRRGARAASVGGKPVLLADGLDVYLDGLARVYKRQLDGEDKISSSRPRALTAIAWNRQPMGPQRRVGSLNLRLRTLQRQSQSRNLQSRTPQRQSQSRNLQSRHSRSANLESRNLQSRTPQRQSQWRNLQSRTPQRQSQWRNLQSRTPQRQSQWRNLQSRTPQRQSQSRNLQSRTPQRQVDFVRRRARTEPSTRRRQHCVTAIDGPLGARGYWRSPAAATDSIPPAAKPLQQQHAGVHPPRSSRLLPRRARWFVNAAFCAVMTSR